MNNHWGGTGELRVQVWFWSVVGLMAAIWVLLPTLLHTGYRNDVIELQSIAPEWVVATKKHPMLPAWILETLNILTGRSFAAPFIASQFCTVLALWSVWKLGRTVLDERLALIGAFAMLPYSFFTGQSVLYNQNNVLIAFWCWSIYLVFQALQTNQMRYWVSAGIALGLTFHAKYPAVFLVLSILAYMMIRENGRKHFRAPGPYLTAFVTFLVFLPHLVWLSWHHFAPFSYLSDSRPVLEHGYRQILAPFHFAANQMIYWIPTLIIMIPVIGFAWEWRIRKLEQPSKPRECEKFLFYCFMVPLVCHMIYCGIKGIHLRMAYGAPFWVFGGLWLLLRFQETKETWRCFRRVVVLMFAIELVMIAGFCVTFFSEKQVLLVYYPTHELGTACERLWHSRCSGHCPYIVGDDPYIVGHAAYAMPVRPSVILPQGTWANDADLNTKGGMIVWKRDVGGNDFPEHFLQRFPKAEVLTENLELPYRVGKKPQTLLLGIAVVPPPIP